MLANFESDMRAARLPPNRPIRIVVCVPAGGGVDTVTRIVADKLGQKLGQPVVVENRTGQSGNVGAEYVFAAAPDGYTLLASQPAPLTVNVLLYKKINFEPTAFIPVAIMTAIPNTLTVRPDFPAKTIQEFIAYAKAHPGTLNYASQGTGTTSHLTAELFSTKTGIKMLHVPYRGTAPAINDLISSHVDLMFTEMASAIEMHKGGRARILAVSAERALVAPARHPDLHRSGRAGFHLRHLERDLGAAEDAARDRRQAQRRDRRGAQDARRAGAADEDQHEPAADDARAGRQGGQGRHAALGRGDQGGGSQAGGVRRATQPASRAWCELRRSTRASDMAAKCAFARCFAPRRESLRMSGPILPSLLVPLRLRHDRRRRRTC